jgi:hypothetical protein
VTQTLTPTIPRRLVLSSNDRRHYHATRRIVAELRALAAYTARALELRPMDSAIVFVAVAYPDRKRRDTPNLWPTIKPLLDGIVTDAGILPDDDDQHLPLLTFRRSRRSCPTGHVVVELTLIDAPEPDGEDDLEHSARVIPRCSLVGHQWSPAEQLPDGVHELRVCGRCKVEEYSARGRR